ncbi:MAG: hypothetical protein R2799_16615 [Crocinitomicaceae bacterium]
MSEIPKSNAMLKKAKWIEIVGLAILLIASFWQIFIVSFFEENFVDSQNYANEEIFYDLLASQVDIAQMSLIEDLEKRYEILNELSQRNAKRRTETILARQRKFEIWRDGAQVYQNIRIALFTIGSLLLLFSKYLEIQSLKIVTIKKDDIESGENIKLIPDKQSNNRDDMAEEHSSKEITDSNSVHDEHVG